jgi:protein O-GlcNAc transferase
LKHSKLPKPGNRREPGAVDLSTLTLLYDQRRFVEVEALALKLTRSHPDHVTAWKALGIVRHLQGRTADAYLPMRKAAQLAPQDAEAHSNLGGLQQAKGQFAEARTSYRRALALKPDLAGAHNNLGIALKDQGRLSEAEASYRRALAIQARHADAESNLGNALRDQDRPSEAYACYGRALLLRPDRAENHNALGGILLGESRLAEAQSRLRSALALNPALAEVHHNLAICRQKQGEVADAVVGFRRALAVLPSFVHAHRTLLCTLLYDAEQTPEALYGEAVRFARQHAPLAPPAAVHPDYTPERRLRVGFVSSDFRTHPLARALKPVFEHRDRAAFSYICYAHATRVDEITSWFRASADEWRDITPLSDREVAARVRRDGIDLLVVLGGRFDSNRPLVAAHRAAPIQLSFFDAATSGVQGMDYFVGDPIVTPEGGHECFVEEVVRLPLFCCYEEQTPVPIAERRPTEGSVVFGGFNNPAKLSSVILALWARVMARLPQSRLVLKYYRAFTATGTRERILRIFAAGGVAAERISFVADGMLEEQPLDRYNEVDIALDSYPFNGVTTTFDALWMGVPVVSLAGDGCIRRMSGFHLVPLGLGDLVATTADDFVEIAVGLAADIERLRMLRHELRDRVRASPLVDGRGFAQSVDTLFHDLWRRKCREARA